MLVKLTVLTDILFCQCAFYCAFEQVRASKMHSIMYREQGIIRQGWVWERGGFASPQEPTDSERVIHCLDLVWSPRDY